MATYVFGDLQGCYDEMMALLKQINYDSEKDELWFVGDIVNRGPKSLECLRFVKQVCESGKGKTVLGNHDFHLLGSYIGMEKYQTKSDTLRPILEAEDADELINWLRLQPLVVKHDYLNAAMVHAGIPPQWTIDEALRYSDEVAEFLAAPNWQENVSEHFFGSDAKEWDDYLTGWVRIRYIVNALVRMRYCKANGKLEFKQKMAPAEATNTKYSPWFTHTNRKNKDFEIFFGHWSTLGAVDAYQVHATDTGCLWGGCLTAYCIETHKRHTLECSKLSDITD